MKSEIDAKMAFAHAKIDDNSSRESDIDELLNFTENILFDPVSFWQQCSINQKQQNNAFRGFCFPME
jgi:hypothetical protein